ncbi:MAG: DoxX family protein [Paludibacter sp.]|nr:DoxX family protein [Paludibacter sp.]
MFLKNINNSQKTALWQNTANRLMHISRILLAIVFIFSGFVKLIDPLGLTYKIEDYLIAFGNVFTSLTFIALPAAIALPVLELIIGLNLLFMIHLRRTSFVALLFMLVMTPLTLYIAIYNPVTDCGCFGDALVISNWQTFYKNLVLITLAISLLITTREKKPTLLPHIEWMAVFVFVASSVGLSVYSFNYLPLIDFLPYKIGTNIPEAMHVPEDAISDKYNTTFIYDKNGVQQEFTLENYPKGDSTWTFVDQKTVLISEGYKAPIHNFSIIDARYDDITEDVIYYEGFTYLLIMYDLNKTSVKGAQKAEKIYTKYKNTTTLFYALTGSTDDHIATFREKTGVTFPLCKTDPITLKTMIRANPGLMLIKNGNITKKWNWRDF